MSEPTTRAEAILELKVDVLNNGAKAEIVLMSRDDADELAYELGMPRVDIIHGLRVRVDRGMESGWFLVLAKTDFERFRAVKRTMTPRAWKARLREEFVG